MRFEQTTLEGVWLLEPERIHDERGFFARAWCHGEFAQRGLVTDLAQCNISYNRSRGTLRGLHYQRAPHGETKLVRCTRGAIWDVVVDLRPESPTYCRWYAAELTADNHRMLYIPEGFAHGFQTLTDDSEVFYQMSTLYHGPSAAGVRWNDSAFSILWPEVKTRVISERDQAHADYQIAKPLSKSLASSDAYRE